MASFFLFSTSLPTVAQIMGDEQMKLLRGQFEAGNEEGKIEDEEPYIYDKDREIDDRDNQLEIIKESEENKFKIIRPKDFNQEPVVRDFSSDLKPFGYDLFSKATNTFAPATDIPIPNNYILGPGDNLKIFLFGNTSKNYSLQVSREGAVFIPEVGVVAIAGLSFSEARQSIKDRLRESNCRHRSSYFSRKTQIYKSFYFR